MNQMRTVKIAGQLTNSRSKTLFVEMTPAEHSVLKIEAAIEGRTMCDIVRSQLIEQLKKKHKMLMTRIGGEK